MNGYYLFERILAWTSVFFGLSFDFVLDLFGKDISEALKSLRIRLSDVLQYQYRIGQNYIPKDLSLELPKKDIDNQKTNSTAPAT